MGDARKCCSAWGRLSDSTPLKQQNSDLLRRARLQQRLTTLPRSQVALGNAKCPRNFVASAWGEAQLRRQVRSQVQLGNEKHCKRHYSSEITGGVRLVATIQRMAVTQNCRRSRGSGESRRRCGARRLNWL